MTQLATITSKKQLTLPTALFRKAGFREGQKVIVSEENGSLKLTPVKKIIEELAGSIPIPNKWKGKEIDEIVDLARTEYLKEKYHLK